MNYFKLILVFIIPIMLLTFSACDSSNEPETRNWTLVWQDEFDGPAGQLPDSTRWSFDVGTHWGNNQLEYDTDRPENASLDGAGSLAIVARQESYMDRNYTSARIQTLGKIEQTYGRFEARMQLPWGQGIWPAFWMLGTECVPENFPDETCCIGTAGWPDCGEIDIMEYRGQEPFRIHGSVHGPGYSGADPVTERYDLVNGRFDTGFHLYAVEWSSDNIKWYVDGKLYHTVTPSDLPGPWVYDGPCYIIINLAVGGNYVGLPNESTVFPQTMLIDYVRVYK